MRNEQKAAFISSVTIWCEATREVQCPHLSTECFEFDSSLGINQIAIPFSTLYFSLPKTWSKRPLKERMDKYVGF